MNKNIVASQPQTSLESPAQNDHQSPWRGLEISGLTAPWSHWRKCLGISAEAFLPFLQKRNELDTHIACDRCGCAHEVIRYDHNLLAEIAARISGWTQKSCATEAIAVPDSFVAVCRCPD